MGKPDKKEVGDKSRALKDATKKSADVDHAPQTAAKKASVKDASRKGLVTVSTSMKLQSQKPEVLLKTALSQANVTNLSPGREARLLSLIKANPNKSPEDIPTVLAEVSAQLKTWGYKEVKDRDEASIVNKKTSGVEGLLRKGYMPTKDYKTNEGIFGFEAQQSGNSMVYAKSRYDLVVDAFSNIFQAMDDNGGDFWGALLNPSARMRSKTDMSTTAQNIKDFGLDGTYKPTISNGNVVKIQEDLTDHNNGAAYLGDILRQRNDSYIQKFDQKKALELAAKMVEEKHKKGGRGIGELLTGDILIKAEKNGEDVKMTGARLSLPDSKYENHVPTNDQKAMDLLDLCFSTGSAAIQESMKNPSIDSKKRTKEFIEAILWNYSDTKVKTSMSALLGKGKPYFTQHNSTRLGFNRTSGKQSFEDVKTIINQVLNPGTKPSPSSTVQ